MLFTKKITIIIALVFIISFVFCNENEIYILHPNAASMVQKWTFEVEVSSEFDVPGVGYIQDVRTFTRIIEYLGEEGGFGKLKLTLTDMKANYRVSGLEVNDYYWTSMNNAPFLLYINSEGFVDHVEPVDKKDSYLQDAFERKYDCHCGNYRFSFGQNASNYQSGKAVGDSWDVDWGPLPLYINDYSPVSLESGKSVFTLKKVKKRNGREIAYIDIKENWKSEMHIVFPVAGERIFIDGGGDGVKNATVKWDMEDGRTISYKENGYLDGDFKWGDKEFSSRIWFKTASKLVK